MVFQFIRQRKYARVKPRGIHYLCCSLNFPLCMTPQQWTYTVFGIVIVLALIFDLGLLSKKGEVISIKKALVQTCFWVALSFGFFAFIWHEDGSKTSRSNTSRAYLMEWSLSIDNIFVFILIFRVLQDQRDRLCAGAPDRHSHGYRVPRHFYYRWRGPDRSVRLDTVHISAHFLYTPASRCSWWTSTKNSSPKRTLHTVFMQKSACAFRTPSHYDRFTIKHSGKVYFTSLAVVVVMLAVTDIVFALDSIPAVFAISKEPLVVYTSTSSPYWACVPCSSCSGAL